MLDVRHKMALGRLLALPGLLLWAVVVYVGSAWGQVRLPRLVSDGMVLQRNAPARLWGWAAPGEKVALTFGGKTYPATANAAGEWAVQLDPLPAGGPHRLEIQASNRITIDDILVGEVWVCSGQSNMVLPMERVKERYPDVIARAENPRIRHFSLPVRYDFNTPQPDIAAGRWEAATPETVLRFSATAYFFARELYDRYGVPIGLINASVGGSPAEAWLSEEALRAFPDYLATARRFKDSTLIQSIQARERAVRDAWYGQVARQDRGLRGKTPWYDPAYDASAWSTMQLPAFWADRGLPPANGVYWFRKEFHLPASLAGKPGKLLLGRIVDQDSVYLNGAFVGTTGYQYPPRRYTVPAGLLRAGKNVLTVRVINTSGKGGFAVDKPYQLSAEGQTIDLKGEWRYRQGVVMDSLPPTTFMQYKPLGLFNGMIAPLLPYTIKGVIWYQGESNTDHPGDYHRLLPALIADWRRQWEQGDFPFLFVQLPNFGEANDQPRESNWAQVREAQRRSLYVPNTGMAVAIDLGEWNDLHPLNKQDVGHRLALAARAVAYGETTPVASGPVYQSVRREGAALRIAFTGTGSGLVARGGGKLRHFAVAGADRRFVWADARIEGNTVVVRHDQVPNPVVVRYAWADNPEGANLYNREGLPASPFQAEVPFKEP